MVQWSTTGGLMVQLGAGMLGTPAYEIDRLPLVNVSLCMKGWGDEGD